MCKDGEDRFHVLQWGHRLSAMESRDMTSHARRVTRSLQWGHRLSAMERIMGERIPRIIHLLQWGHRLSAMERVGSNCGSGPTFSLQWGHRLSAMESGHCTDGTTTLSMELQWGHRLSAMESRDPLTGFVDVGRASMGPPPFGDGKNGISLSLNPG